MQKRTSACSRAMRVVAYRSSVSARAPWPPWATKVPIRTAGRRAFSWTVPVTQRHTADQHHLKANFRPRTGWTGLLAAQGSLAEVLSKQHPAATQAYHAAAGARYADPDVRRPVVMAALAWSPRSRGRVRPTPATLPADSPAISVGVCVLLRTELVT